MTTLTALRGERDAYQIPNVIRVPFDIEDILDWRIGHRTTLRDMIEERASYGLPDGYFEGAEAEITVDGQHVDVTWTRRAI